MTDRSPVRFAARAFLGALLWLLAGALGPAWAQGPASAGTGSARALLFSLAQVEDEATEDEEEPAAEEPAADEEAAPESEESEGDLIVRAIEFRGNRRITDEQMLLVMRTRPGQPFSAATLQEDLRRIGEFGVFAAPPERLLERTGVAGHVGVKIIIIVEENPLFTGVEVQIVKGPGLFPTGDLERAFMENSEAPLALGDLISTRAIDAGVAAIQEVYRKEGYTAASVVDVIQMPGETNRGKLLIEVNEGVIAEVRIEGNTKTETSVIRREVHLRPGQIYNVSVLAEDLRALISLQLFDDIVPEFEFTETREVIIVLKIIEARTGQLGFGVGYSSSDGILGTLSYAERNFRGRGENVKAGLQIGGPDPEGNLSYFVPHFDSRGSSLGIELFRQSFTDTARDPDDPRLFTEFDNRRTGGEVKYLYPLSEKLKASFGLTLFKGEIDVTGTSTADLEDVSEFARRGLLEGQSNSITLGVIHDTRDFALDPSRGNHASLTSQNFGGLLGGDFDAIKITGEYKHFWRLSSPPPQEVVSASSLPTPHVIAWRLLAGGTLGDLSLLDSFELGGNTTIRGTEFAAQSGDKAFLTNLEYRFPLITNLSGAVFIDAGTAAQPGEELSLDNLLTTIGGGIRYRIPFLGAAPLRLDWGYDIQEGDGQVVLGFGQLF